MRIYLAIWLLAAATTGAAIHQWEERRRLLAAVEQVSTCETDGDCDYAWTQLDAARGKR